MELPRALRDALDAEVAGVAIRDLTAATDRLIARYRTPGEPDEPILRTAADVAAYAAYRMPATFSAVRRALAQLPAGPVQNVADLPATTGEDWRLAPRTHLDLGGGTGAAAWAAADVFPTLGSVTVVDQVAEALALGRRLAARATSAALRSATWRQARVGADLATADLVTISYVLGELAGAEQIDLVRRAGSAGAVVVIVEPGTPAGYERVLQARAVLMEQGLTIAAPCPHQLSCPIVPGRDWCHFAARVNRSSLHRQIKSAELGYEDEKFSYVAATRAPVPAAPGRVLRHPQRRKGLVSLQVCTPTAGITGDLVSKRHGDLYRAARDVEWGDSWPPAQ